MTWDHLATALFAAVYMAILLLVYAAIRRGLPWIGRTPRRVAIGRALLLASCALAIPLAAYDNEGIPSREYPDLLEGYQRASPEEKESMRAVVIEANRRRAIFSFSRHQRDRYLLAGGFCVSWLPIECRQLPKGSEGQGIAIEIFPYIARSGATSHDSMVRCAPRMPQACERVPIVADESRTYRRPQ